MAETRPNESVRRRAQELATKARTTDDPMEALALCEQAIDLDPRCTDALLEVSWLMEPEDRIEDLKETVRMAAEDLGGDEYFASLDRNIWDVEEAQPYMRARLLLAVALAEADDTRSAIAEHEALLALDPEDRRGLRHPLTGLYLEIDDVDGVRRLFSAHHGKYSSISIWAAVLMFLIMDKADLARITLPEARRANPYVEAYLLGLRPAPQVFPDGYFPGDEDEAAVCMEYIGPAWEKHPAAVRWLYKQHAAASAGHKTNIGRNAPCPCGSGKKYKMCCLGKTEPPSPPVDVAPSSVETSLNRMLRSAEEMNFSSLEDANAFLQQQVEEENRKPLDDFCGLSPAQMHMLIDFTFDSPELVDFPCVLDDEPSAPIVTMFAGMVAAIGEKGLKPTAKGNLPLKVVRDIALASLGEDGYAEFTKRRAIRSEDDYRDLHVVRLIAEVAGLVRKYQGRFILTRRCRKLLKQDGMRAVYPALLDASMEELNWAFFDMFPNLDIIQLSSAFTLFLLARYGREWRTNGFYEDTFLRAFPQARDEIEPSSLIAQDDFVRMAYTSRSLLMFARTLGLIEVEPRPNAPYTLDFRLRATPLLADAVRFRIPL